MASSIGKALGFGSLDEGDDSGGDAPMSEGMEPKPKPEDGNSAEVLAMKQFQRAKDPAAMAAALKDFLEACGVYGSDDSGGL